MLRVDRTAEARTTASAARCHALLTDAAGYAAWASLIERVEPAAAVPGAPADAVLLTGRILGLEVEMLCVVEAHGETVRLRRLPFDAADDERYVATWTIEARPDGCALRLHVTAALDAPGPAALLAGQVGRRLVDDLLADAVRAL